ncbi:hypothetical protein AB4Z17_29950 [Paenibacillus sp. TAF43_2]|uniref:hypothetical protein n=1 Tax=Paenibacillus sp. TAF43_2 TaxID=3233069 RepID=UPI003F9906F2
MYFVNEEHERNFYHFLNKYPITLKNNEYRTGYYIVAHPVIYDVCDGKPDSNGHGPFDWYFNEDFNHNLTPAYIELVKAGIHLYNNYEDFSLYLSLGNWRNELFEVFIQACKIRRGED